MANVADGFTSRLLRDAGLAAGQSVLDVGCGSGNVTFEIARIVGPRSRVVGIDASAAMIETARARAAAEGVGNATFEVADLHAVGERGEAFDAIFMRRVLMYLPDQVVAVRALASALRPGGTLIVQEHDATMRAASATLPLHERVHGWLWSTVRHEGADPGTGFGLHVTLTEAGLAVSHVRAEAIVQTPDQSYVTAAIVRALIPRIEAAGVATADEIDVDTLDERLARERATHGATYIGEMIFGAWARRPS